MHLIDANKMPGEKSYTWTAKKFYLLIKRTLEAAIHEESVCKATNFPSHKLSQEDEKDLQCPNEEIRTNSSALYGQWI